MWYGMTLGKCVLTLTTILDIQISLGTKFHLKLKILIFLTKFAQKGYFWSKTEKVNTTIKFCIFNLNEGPNFSSFEFLDQFCLKRIFPVENIKIEHPHWIWYIRFRLASKFQLKLTVLIFLDQVCPKSVFQV